VEKGNFPLDSSPKTIPVIKSLASPGRNIFMVPSKDVFPRDSVTAEIRENNAEESWLRPVEGCLSFLI
jgi:hypothetical protein